MLWKTSQFLRPNRIGFSLFLTGVCALVLLSGCGGEKQPVTAGSSKYEVATDDQSGSESAPGGRLADGSGGMAQGSNVPGSAPSPAAGSGGGSAAMPPKPPAIPAARLDSYDVPDGTAAELLAFIERLAQRQPQGATDADVLADFRKMYQAISEAAEKILAMEGNEAERERAAEYRLGGFGALAQIGDSNVEEQLRAFCQQLIADRNPKIVNRGKLVLFGMKIGDVASGKSQDIDGLIQEVNAQLAAEDRNEEVFSVSHNAAMVLRRMGREEEATAMINAIAAAFQDSPDERLASAAQGLKEQQLFVELDFERKGNAALLNDPGAMPAFMEVVRQVLQVETPGAVTLQQVREAAQAMEITHHYADSAEIYDLVATAYEGHENQQLAELAATVSSNGKKRVSLVGKPFVVEGVTFDGAPFDWSKYKGKVVLIDFWATWCGPCLAEIPNIKKNYEMYRDQGLEVVGVNLDDNRSDVEQFFARQQLPWVTVFSGQPEAQGFQNPLAVASGVDSIPFIVLVGRDGIALDLHVRGEELGTKLAEIFGAGEKSSSRGDARRLERVGRTAVHRPGHPAASSFLSFEGAAAGEGGAADSRDSDAGPASREEGEKADAEEEDVNVYRAPDGLTPAELVDFLLTMEEKPKSIQSRPGFAEAMVDAADRILAAAEAKDRHQVIAAETKFKVLHAQACQGDEQADEQLAQFVQRMKDDTREKIAAEVKFFQLEKRVLDVDEMPLDQVPGLLAELRDFYQQQTLAARHLRMASSTVHAINRLESDDEREKYFSDFGNLFAKSGDKELARYGKKLAKPAAASDSELVGQPLELAGVTALGTAFDWNSYRGKVVLVDFWATWCAPCRREMPHVKELFERSKDRGFEVVGVSLDKDLAALATYLEENKIPWSNLVGDETQELAGRYGVRGIPTMMLVDREGKVVRVSHNVAQLAPDIEKMLEQPAAN